MKSLNLNDSGKKYLLENCNKISINTITSQYKKQLKEMVMEETVIIADQPITLTKAKTGVNGVRYWFLCPFCDKKVGTLFQHPVCDHIGCRNCLNLEYRSRLKKGMLEEKDTLN